MAEIVLGIGTSHSPVLSMPPEGMPDYAAGDRRNKQLLRAPEGKLMTYEELEAAADPKTRQEGSNPDYAGQHAPMAEEPAARQARCAHAGLYFYRRATRPSERISLLATMNGITTIAEFRNAVLDPAKRAHMEWRQQRLFELWQVWDSEIRRINPAACYIPNTGGGALSRGVRPSARQRSGCGAGTTMTATARRANTRISAVAVSDASRLSNTDRSTVASLLSVNTHLPWLAATPALTAVG